MGQKLLEQLALRHFALDQHLDVLARSLQFGSQRLCNQAQGTQGRRQDEGAAPGRRCAGCREARDRRAVRGVGRLGESARHVETR